METGPARALRIARNVAIVLALAAVVDFAPGGGDGAYAVSTAISLAFAALIGWLGFRLHRERSLTLSVLTDQQRIALYGAVGVLVFVVAGIDEMLETGVGVGALLLLTGGAIVTIVNTLRDVNSI